MIAKEPVAMINDFIWMGKIYIKKNYLLINDAKFQEKRRSEQEKKIHIIHIPRTLKKINQF